jgi:hypothetical protein
MGDVIHPTVGCDIGFSYFLWLSLDQVGMVFTAFPRVMVEPWDQPIPTPLPLW